jgi:hypothetical protein
MQCKENHLLDIFKKSILVLGIISSIGIFGYGLSYIIKMPAVSPDGFVPKTLGNNSSTTFGFGNLLALFILMYAFAFLPVTIMFTIKKYRTNPYALIIASSLITISLIVEIINNLPLFAAGLFSGKLERISPDIQLYLRQIETIKYLAFDVVGFALAYLAFLIYAIVFFKSDKVLSYTIIGSVFMFIINIPFLWFMPIVAVVLMVISIFAFALVPIYMARMAIKSLFLN